MNSHFFVNLLLASLVYALSFTSGITSSSLQKRYSISFIPTLSVQIGSSVGQLPVPFNNGSIMDYQFPVGKMFNLSCMIKHPSFRYHMKIKRNQIYNNGTKGEYINMVRDDNYELLTTEIVSG